MVTRLDIGRLGTDRRDPIPHLLSDKLWAIARQEEASTSGLSSRLAFSNLTKAVSKFASAASRKTGISVLSGCYGRHNVPWALRQALGRNQHPFICSLNWLPWSVFMISGGPKRWMASFSASTQKSASGQQCGRSRHFAALSGTAAFRSLFQRLRWVSRPAIST
jgi:hypothetical protein